MRRIPETHPIHGMFRTLTSRAMANVGLSDAELVRYLASMLVRFAHIDGLYRLSDESGVPRRYLVDMMARAEESPPPRNVEAFQHVGDYTHDPFYQYVFRQFGVSYAG